MLFKGVSEEAASSILRVEAKLGIVQIIWQAGRIWSHRTGREDQNHGLKLANGS